MADPLLTTAGSQVPPSSQTLNLRLGARLLAAADVFVFVGFLFAYLYLRSINAHGLWHPPHTSPSVALGSVTLVAMVGSALAVLYALRVLRSDHDDAWRAAAGVGLGLCVVALGVQLWQLFDPGFSPSSGGGFGSVFVGFTAVPRRTSRRRDVLARDDRRRGEEACGRAGAHGGGRRRLRNLRPVPRRRRGRRLHPVLPRRMTGTP